VFGRYHSKKVVDPDGTVRTSIVELPREQWPVVIHDHHPGYITWDDYLANQARLAANLTRGGARPPREGQAICQGIITLWILWTAHVDALLLEWTGRLRVYGPQSRPDGHPHVSVHQRYQCGRSGGRTAPRGAQP
jgi:hypothetical protein